MIERSFNPLAEGEHRLSFVHRPVSFTGPSDVLRFAIRPDGARWLAIANAYEGSFSTCFPAGSRLLLDAAEAGFRSGALPEQVASSAIHSFFEAHPTDPDGDDPSVTSLMAFGDARGWTLISLGGELAQILGPEGWRAWPPEQDRYVFSPRISVRHAWRGQIPEFRELRVGPETRALELQSARLADRLGDRPLERPIERIPLDWSFFAALRWSREGVM